MVALYGIQVCGEGEQNCFSFVLASTGIYCMYCNESKYSIKGYEVLTPMERAPAKRQVHLASQLEPRKLNSSSKLFEAFTCNIFLSARSLHDADSLCPVTGQVDKECL